MKIYVKETQDFTIKKVRPLINNTIDVYPLISTSDICYNDLIFVSKFDSSPLTPSTEHHIVIYESLFEQLSIRIDQIYSELHDYYYLKHALINSTNPEISTLISGSSYGAMGIDLSYIDHAVNLSSVSQDLYYSQKLILQACQSNSNIKNIVLCFGYYFFYSDLSLSKTFGQPQRLSNIYYPLLHDTHNCLLLPPKTDFCIHSDIINIEAILEDFTYTEYQRGFFNEFYPRSNHDNKLWSDKTKNWAELSTYEQDTAGKIRAESHNKSIKHLATFNENICLFQDFVNYCNKSDINLLIAVPPVTKYYLKYLNPEYRDNFYSVLEHTEGTIHLLDLSDDNTFDNSTDFIDTDHLSDLGAAKFSSMISSTLNEIE